MYKIIIIMIISFPILSFSRTLPEDLYQDSLSFGIVNRISGQNIVFGKDSSSKTTPITTTIMELYYGSPFSFFYSGIRISAPLSSFSYEEQSSNYSLQQINSLSVGTAIGGGYGFLFDKHRLKIIFTINIDIGIRNSYFSTQSPSQQVIWGTEVLFRYHYTIHKKISLILGIDTGIHIYTKELEDANSKEMSGLSILYGGVIGFGF